MDVELISPGDWVKEQVKAVQDYALVAARSMGNLFTRPRYVADSVEQADIIGVGSVFIVALAGLFTGGRWHRTAALLCNVLAH